MINAKPMFTWIPSDNSLRLNNRENLFSSTGEASIVNPDTHNSSSGSCGLKTVNACPFRYCIDYPRREDLQVLSGFERYSISNYLSGYVNRFVGLRVGQIHVIFNLPPQFGLYPHPLAYVEWFTPLGTKDKVSELQSNSCSTRALCRNAEIISAMCLVRACHLVGKCRRKIDER